MGDEELNRWIKEGAAEERAAIVAWLPTFAKAYSVDSTSPAFLEDVLAAIERGDHLSKSEGGR